MDLEMFKRRRAISAKQRLLIFLAYSLFSSAYVLAEGNVRDLRDYRYWDNGNVRECTIYDVNGSLKANYTYRYDGSVEKVEKFDGYGNKIEEALYDEKGRLKTGIDGWAAMRWWYEGYRRLSQITYDEYGRTVERKQFSESGRLMLRQYKDDEDEDLNPYEEASMAMLLGNRNLRYRSREKMEEGSNLIKK